MKKIILALSAVSLFSVLSVGTALAADETGRRLPQPPAASSSENVTITAKITQLNAATGHVVLVDQNRKLWSFDVPPKSGIDLTKYKVGDTVTAVIRVESQPTGPTTRARISKQELLRLQ